MAYKLKVALSNCKDYAPKNVCKSITTVYKVHTFGKQMPQPRHTQRDC